MQALKSKTINFAMLLGIFGAAQANMAALQDFIAPSVYGYMTVGVAVVVAALRAVTSKPLTDK